MAGQPAAIGTPTSRPRPTRQLRPRNRAVANGQICRATPTYPASSITQDNAHSTSKTRNTMRIAAPFPAPPIVRLARSQHNARRVTLCRRNVTPYRCRHRTNTGGV